MGGGVRSQDSGLGFRFFPTPCIAMPIHPHLTDLAVSGLAEERPACVDPFAGAAAAERAPKLRGEPRTDLEHFSGAERHLRLGHRQVLPIAPDRRQTDLFRAEGRLVEDRIGREYRADPL